MKRWLLMSALGWSAAHAQPLESLHQAIYNGQRAARHVTLTDAETLAIGWLHIRGSANSPFCTGTFIDRQTVITARHCIKTDNLAFSVGGGPDQLVATIPVRSTVVHPHLDVALLGLSEPYPENRVPQLTPIIVAEANYAADMVGTFTDAAGHGETEVGQGRGLFFAQVRVVCTDQTFVQVDGEGEEGICGGDSGGPILGRNPQGAPVVLSVESAGDNSCVGLDRGTRIDQVRTWIDDQRVQFLGFAAQDECAGLSYRGHCQDDVAEWCANGKINRRNCAEDQQRCGYANADSGLYCRAPLPCIPTDPTHCTGGVLRRCVAGEWIDHDCVSEGKICATNLNDEAQCESVCDAEKLNHTISRGEAALTRQRGEGVSYEGRFALGDCSSGLHPTAPPWAVLSLGLIGWIRKRRQL